MRENSDVVIEVWRSALVDLRRILNLLDETGAPADIGAQIDFGICKLADAVHDVLNRAGPTDDVLVGPGDEMRDS